MFTWNLWHQNVMHRGTNLKAIFTSGADIWPGTIKVSEDKITVSFNHTTFTGKPGRSISELMADNGDKFYLADEFGQCFSYSVGVNFPVTIFKIGE